MLIPERDRDELRGPDVFGRDAHHQELHGAQREPRRKLSGKLLRQDDRKLQ